MIGISIIIILILGYISWNLYRKNIRLEKMVLEYDEVINNFSKTVEDSSIRLKEIDEKGTFESDDEIGWFFENVKSLQNGLDTYRNKPKNEEKAKGI